MAYVREALNAHVNEFIDKEIYSSFTQVHPLFYFLGIGKPDENNKLNRPQTAQMFGGAKMGSAQKTEMLGSKSHHYKFVKSKPNDGAAVEYGGATPTAAGFAEDNFGTVEIFWTHIMEPLKIRKHSLEQAKGIPAVGSIVDESMAPVWERFTERIHQGFWTGTRTQAQQNVEVWGDFLGLQHTLTSNNYYGRVDRSVETTLNPLAINAATQLPSSVVELSIIRKINNGFTDQLSASIEGLAGKSRNGAGATCVIVPSNLWQTLADESDGRYQIHVNGIPNTGMGGFKRPIIEFDNAYITWDPFCPAGEMYLLNLETWVVEIQKGHNFKWLGFTDKSVTEEGGDYIEWGNFTFQGRMACRAPFLNSRVYGLTAA